MITDGNENIDFKFLKKIPNLKAFPKKYKLEVDTMAESKLRKTFNYKRCPRSSIITTDKGFTNIDTDSLGV